jgi:hypothetical protein
MSEILELQELEDESLDRCVNSYCSTTTNG